jgi:AbrB family looped-hinge helix DNA binding protein
MRVTSKGQVTIPKEIRNRHDIRAGSEVEFVEKGVEVVVRRQRQKAPVDRKDDFAAHLDRVTGIVDIGMSTDDFMRLMRGE